MKIKGNLSWILGYVVIDLICVGMGMGVPFFCILLGFPLGWFLAHKFIDIRKVLKYSLLTSAFTFLMMVVIWLSAMSPYFLNSTKDIANFGEPLLLFTPIASFWGWLVLMVIISPFLQLLTTVFTAYLTFLPNKNHSK